MKNLDGFDKNLENIVEESKISIVCACCGAKEYTIKNDKMWICNNCKGLNINDYINKYVRSNYGMP